MEIWVIDLQLKVVIFPVPPVDSEQDMRGEYLKNLKEVGIKVEKTSP
jgi:glutamine synthetase